ncbi:hypothetical protein ACTJIJ_24285 [Niabella sp. 22666]|uniref:hypothetical protein n=1 Tax=Niabella sp. 22666 TaxID=3453954 RepID=UPI003F8648C9
MIFIIASMAATGQEKNEKFILDFDRSRHGTGDMNGIFVNLQYSKGFARRFDWYGDIGFSIHDLVYLNDNPNNPAKNEIYEQRYVTAGLQLGGGIAFKPLIGKNEFSVQLGPLVRYQSSSLPVSAGILYPEFTKLPFMVEEVKHMNEPLRTFNVGARLRLAYYYTFSRNILIGANANFQTDTYGDVIHAYGLSVGKRF